MIKMKLSDIARYTGGKLAGQDIEISSVGIDTRTLASGDLYIAIKGHQFDGNNFIGLAEQAGAAAAILHPGFTTSLPYITVDDTRLALGKLASAWRDKAGAKVVGITGSNGKTTVKEMTAAILSEDGETLFTKGNLNNDIGVPLTLLRINEQHHYAVIEMGANHIGEIAYTSKLTKADVVILNNAGAAHLEGFGSLDGVAKGKGEIVETLKRDGIAVLNKDDKYFTYWQGVADDRKIYSFGLNPDADVRAQAIGAEIADEGFVTSFELLTPKDSIKINLKLAGVHNVMNALAAAGAALALGLSLAQIKRGVEKVKPVTGRLQLLAGKKGNLVIDDTYNANATSLKAGLEVLKTCRGKPWLVLGAFGEVGPDSAKVHKEIGELIRSSGVVRLLAVGSDARNTVEAYGGGATFFENQDDLINTLQQELTGDETILIKGSRAQRMEKIAAALVENYRT